MGKIFEKVKYSKDINYYYVFGKRIGRSVEGCFYFGEYGNEWYVGWHDWKFELTYRECGYDEPNGELHISILGWHSVFKFPWKSKRFPDGDCDAPEYGIAVHNNTFWIYRGGNGNMGGGTKWWTWDLPYFTEIHVRHEVECNVDGEIKMIPYENLESRGKDYIPLKDNKLVNVHHYDYTDNYDGEIIPCTYWIEEREWRPKWFTWTDKFKYVRRYIEIEFSNEVGKQKGSWKGGCIGCSYNLLDGETPEECIRRMEKERKF